MKRLAYILPFVLGLCCTIVALTACSDAIYDNDVDCDRTDPADPADMVYLGIRIYNTDDAATSRADNRFDSEFPDDSFFNKGLAAERAIFSDFSNHSSDSPHYIIFFDNDGNRVREAAGGFDLLRLWIWRGLSSPSAGSGDISSSFTSLYCAVTTDDPLYKAVMGDGSTEGFRFTGKILVVLNANPDIAAQIRSKSTYSEISSIVAENADVKSLYFSKDGVDYFTMSSSMIIKSNTGGTKEVVPANENELNPNYTIRFYETEQDALNNAFNMYVERLQAKYTLLFNRGISAANPDQYYFDSSISATPSGSAFKWAENVVYDKTHSQFPTADNATLRIVTSYSRNNSIDDVMTSSNLTVSNAEWKVNITGWSVNALMTQEHLFKRLTADADYFTNWNSSYISYRNFWAESPDYSSRSFPDQTRYIISNPASGLTQTSDDSKSLYDVSGLPKTATLSYFNYPDMRQRSPHQYSPENTFAASIFGSGADALKKSLDTKAFLRAGTHVIVTAQLLIEDFDPEDVYRANDFDASGLAVANDEQDRPLSAADKFYMNGIYWTEQAYKEYVAEYLAYWMLTDAYANGELDASGSQKGKIGPNDGNFYVSDVNGDKEDADGNKYRLAKGTDFQIARAYIKGGDGYVCISPSGTLYRKDSADSYTVIPSEQFSYLLYDHPEYMAGRFTEGRMYYPVPIRHNSSDSETTIRTGDFGVVRNHWYHIEVDAINSPGLPVDVVNQPIVPNPEPEFPGLGVNIRVLDWHHIETDVDVGSQPRP